jgi:photosystem II stability/assembly factor-like uncharacterized protein
MDWKKGAFMKSRISLLITVGLLILAAQACTLPGNQQLVIVTPTQAVALVPADTATSVATATQPQPTPVPSSTVPVQPGPVVTAPQLTSIHFFDELHGWGTTADAILSTADGGQTWFNITPQSAFAVGGMPPVSYFFDPAHGWVAVPNVADPMGTSQLFITANGGVSWTTSTLATSMGGMFSFVDASTGFYMADLGAGAGGATWKPGFAHQPSMGENPGDLPGSGIKSGISFRDATHGWITGNIPMDNYIYLYATTDGGITWTLQPASTPADLGTVFAGTYPPVFFGNSGIMPVTLVGSVTNLAIYTSSDGGATWKAAPGFVANAGRGELVDFVSPTDGFAWATGRFAVTHDGAQTWGTVTPSVAFGDNMAALDFVNTTTGWILTMDASSHTALYKTADGGVNWTTLIP